MKGMIFTELLDMVEETQGLLVKDRIIERAQPPCGGAYTAVGDYPFSELHALVLALSEETGQPVPKLLEVFGHHIFGLFTRSFGIFFDNVDNCFDFLANIENYIHVEVHKLYPQAELPTFRYPERSDQQLVMVYESPRPLASFASGLISAAIEHFAEPIELDFEDISGGQGTSAKFTLTRRGG